MPDETKFVIRAKRQGDVDLLLRALEPGQKMNAIYEIPETNNQELVKSFVKEIKQRYSKDQYPNVKIRIIRSGKDNTITLEFTKI